MRRILVLLLLAVTAVLATAGVAQAFNVTVTPISVPPVYNGGSGTGYWVGSYDVTPNNNYQNWQVRVAAYLIVDSTYIYRSTGYPYYDRTADGWDGGSEVNYQPGTPRHFNQAMMAQDPSSCPYHGYHWFGTIVYYEFKYLNGGSWSAWSSPAYSAAGPGVYAQVCV